MPVQFQTRKMGRIQEERQFTNPAVRFIRVRGRIVPIINKKRTGQLTNKAGNKLAIGGAAIGLTGLLGSKSRKAIRGNFQYRRTKMAFNKSFGSKISKSKNLFKAGRKSKTLGFLGKGLVSKKVGAAVFGVGVGLKVIGNELEARSPLGADFLAEKK